MNTPTRRRPASKPAFVAATVLLVLLSACAGEQPRTETTGETAPPVPMVAAPSTVPIQSPDSFQVAFETNKGTFTVAVTRALAPKGADRLYELVKAGYFSDVRFFRMVPGFVVQFGIHGDPKVYAEWSKAVLPDEPMRIGNTRGTVAFTTAGPNTRAVQLFVSTADNRRKLDPQRLFAPVGKVIDGMDVVDSLNAEYGEEPNQSRIAASGNGYLQRWFPALDYIVAAKIIEPARP